MQTLMPCRKGVRKMGKKLYISIIGLLVLVSIGIGVFSYQFMIKQQKLTRQLEQFEWVIPLGTEYSSFDGNIGEKFFTGVRAGTYEEDLFDQNGKIVASGQNVDVGKELYTYEEDGLQGIKDTSAK